MRSVTLLALGIMWLVAWPHDDARGQSSGAPPVSLAPHDASPPRQGANKPARVTTNRASPAAAGRATSTPATGGPLATPNPAADYDGYSFGIADDNDVPYQAIPPMRSRAARDASSNADADSIGQEDGALKRKLMICQNCR